MRFEIDLQVCYRQRFSKTTHFGKIVNISAVGILFTVQNSIPLGAAVEVIANWPAKGKGDKPLKLVIQGRVVRAQPGALALEIGRAELVSETQATARWNRIE
jgi:hypothetical protein